MGKQQVLMVYQIEHLKIVELIAPSLTDLFNFSISTKTYPGGFKTARVAPVFKKGDKAV